MTLTITQAFDLPSPEDITAQEFDIKLHSEDDDERDRKLVKDYVFTPTVRHELPVIFNKLQHVLERGEDAGASFMAASARARATSCRSSACC